MKLSETSIDFFRYLHHISFKSRPYIEASTQCGCFYCCAIFKPAEITKWCDNGQTALCPRCGIDSVLGDDQVKPISTTLLKMMNIQFFGPGLNNATQDELYVIDDKTGEKSFFHFFETEQGFKVEEGREDE